MQRTITSTAQHNMNVPLPSHAPNKQVNKNVYVCGRAHCKALMVCPALHAMHLSCIAAPVYLKARLAPRPMPREAPFPQRSGCTQHNSKSVTHMMMPGSEAISKILVVFEEKSRLAVNVLRSTTVQSASIEQPRRHSPAGPAEQSRADQKLGGCRSVAN